MFAEFRAGAPAIARATEALGPFAHAATPALTIARAPRPAKSQQPLVNSDPILRKIREPRREGRPRAPRAWRKLLASLRKTRRLQAADQVPLQHDRRDQRLRPVRPLPARRLRDPHGLHVPGRDAIAAGCIGALGRNSASGKASGADQGSAACSSARRRRRRSAAGSPRRRADLAGTPTARACRSTPRATRPAARHAHDATGSTALQPGARAPRWARRATCSTR